MTPGQQLEVRSKVNEAASTFNAAARAYEAERKRAKGVLADMDTEIVDNYFKARENFNAASNLERQFLGGSSFVRRPFTGGMGATGGSATAPGSSGVIDFGSLAR